MNGLNQKASEFPDSPGVYRFFKNKKILYIGKAKSLKKRVKTYFGKSLKEFKTQKLVNQITGMDFIETNNETEALLLEQNLIKTEQPPFNILLRDDKTFPYIELTEKHDFPGIFFKRTRKSEKNLFGPFTSASATRLAISEIQKIFNQSYELTQLIEEGFKFIGIVCWLNFWCKASSNALKFGNS